MHELNSWAIGTSEIRQWCEENGLEAEKIAASTLSITKYMGGLEASWQEFVFDDEGNRITEDKDSKLTEVKRKFVKNRPPTWLQLYAQ